jgi:hypothetical protein
MRNLAPILAGVALAGVLASGCGSSSDGLKVGDVDLGSQLSGLVGQASGALSGVTDTASARDALPQLQSVDAGLDDLSAMATQLNPEQQQELARQASSALPDLMTLASQTTSIPGVSDILGSTVNSITGKLSGLI